MAHSSFKGISKYSESEGTNVQLGQGGAIFLDASQNTTVTMKSNVIVAIQMLNTAVQFDALTPVGTENFPGISAKGHKGYGDAITNSISFPAGSTIYGRWSSVNLNSGTCICYVAG